MKVWYARLVNDNSGTHYVVDTIKSKVFQACKELIESGDYYCDDGDVIIEHQYFSLRRSTVLDKAKIEALEQGLAMVKE